jgi:hypothetical protein
LSRDFVLFFLKKNHKKKMPSGGATQGKKFPKNKRKKNYNDKGFFSQETLSSSL